MGTIKQNRANNIVTDGKIDATDGLNNNVPATNIANASLTNVTAYPPSAGAGVSQLASDPPSPTEGQMWYNTTTNTLKQYVQGAGAWATGGSLNTGRRDLGGAGTQTSGLAFGGVTAASPVYGGSETESYNGSAWTEVNDLNTARRSLEGAGADNTSAIAFGGNTAPGQVAITESWSGTSWTEVNDLNTVRQDFAGSGTQTSALATGGNAPRIALNESWNGTSWTEVGDLNTARNNLAGAGLDNTSALVFGGSVPPIVGNTESWNGTSWTEVNDLNTPRDILAGTGIQTSALAFGGENAGFKGETEEWNGVSWTEVADLNLARYELARAGNTTAALAIGGDGSPPVTTLADTEEWTKGLSVQTITAS
jgi:hypothetical protein